MPLIFCASAVFTHCTTPGSTELLMTASQPASRALITYGVRSPWYGSVRSSK